MKRSGGNLVSRIRSGIVQKHVISLYITSLTYREMNPIKICVLTSTGETSHTIIFSGAADQPAENAVNTIQKIHPDDSIRTIKMKLLYELHKGPNANKIQLRPSYEELYLYGFAKEDTTTLQLFDALKTAEGLDSESDIPLDTIKQIIAGHPDERAILKKLPEGDAIPYADFESVLSEKHIEIIVKTPLGITFTGGRRDATFEVDPFNVAKHRAYLAEHNNLHYFDDNLLLNYGKIIDNTIYVCLADRVFESTEAVAEDYIARYYFAGLYKDGVKSKETLLSKRAKLVKSTQALLTEERAKYYQSIDKFYEIAADGAPLKYISKGIRAITIRIKNTASRLANSEMLFKNMHCTKDVPYIKYNPGNRRENLYRFYFERTTRTGKKIPYLSRAHIMRMAKETGRGQQISAYLEGALRPEGATGGRRFLSNCYAHFESDGDIQLQLTFSTPIDESTLDDIIRNNILPHLSKIGRDVRQTGFSMPPYLGLRNVANTKVVSLEYVCHTSAVKSVKIDAIPCIYSICTLNEEVPGSPPVARLKRVENFREMDAANILIAELYGQVQYGETGLQDIIDELVSRGLSVDEPAARILIAGFLSTINEMNGEIVEKPGFPLEMAINADEGTLDIRITELTSIFYLDTVGVYIDAIVKMTQQYKESNAHLKQLKQLCKKAVKFREVAVEPEDSPKLLRTATQPDGPLRLNKFAASEDDFFAQFASDDEEDVDYAANEEVAVLDEEGEDDAVDLFAKLHRNAQNIQKPVMFDSDEDEEIERKSEDDEDEDEDAFLVPEPVQTPVQKPVQKPEKQKKKKGKEPIDEESFYGRIMQFHSKSAILKESHDKPYLDAGMPNTGMRDLSNFAEFSVEYGGKIYPTVEHAFQSQKYVYAKKLEPKIPKKNAKKKDQEDEPKPLDDILASFTVDGGMTALQANTAGSKASMEKNGYALDVARWERESVPLMEELIKSKIERNEQIKTILKVVRQFELKLAHFSRSDMKWGCHVTDDVKDGKNLLGEIYNRLSLNEELTEELPKEPEPEPTKENPKPEPIAAKPAGPIMFDSEDEEEYGGAKKKPAAEPADFLDSDLEEDIEEGADSDAEEDPDDDKIPDGRALKPVNPLLKRLRRRDPTLFMSRPSGKFKSFSTSCQPTSRHPVILNQEEMDKTDKSAYKHAVKYGSDPQNPNYFICPRFWCFLTNSAISEEDVKAGKCGAIIDKKKADKIPKGSYVYELNEEAHIPGFIENKLANGKCLPCCFKKTWDNKTQSDARKRCESQIREANSDKEDAPDQTEEENGKKTKGKKGKQAEDKPPGKKVTTKTAQYIYSLDTYPVPQYRWGFLPIPVQLFFQIDYRPAIDPNNPALLQDGKEVFLRCGVEQPTNQSFLGCFADIYAHKQGLGYVPSVQEFRRILGEAINLDVFVNAHNGSLLSAFYPKTKKAIKEDRNKYKDTEFALALNLSNKANKRHFDDAILAYENFIEYITTNGSGSTSIDHQYLWDFVCDDNIRIIPKGINLVILEIRANDIIDRIELVCPTNLYSRHQYDTAKDTVILLKHDEFYEPVYLYESNNSGAPNVTRFFSHSKVPGSVADLLKRIEHATRKYCPGMPSLPKIYRFANPIPIQRLLAALVKISAKIESQVVNYQGKTIGLMVAEKGVGNAVYLPCAPSARLRLQIKYMDSLSILSDYDKTVTALNRISAAAKIPCRPIWKIKEDEMVVGFLTETNQFVPITPTEDIAEDGLRTYEGVNDFAADKTVATEHKGDRTRIKLTKYIVLEGQFYHAFRNRVRALLGEFENSKLRNEMRKIADDQTLIYSQKIEKIEPLVERLIDGYVVFVDIGKSVLMDMADVNECEDADDEGPNCIIKENGVAQLVVPKWHLISKYDNERIYVGRMADELVRNDRVKSIMYDTENRLNSKTAEYQIKDDEFILVQSALTPEYFADMDSVRDSNPYAKQTNYELAHPSISVVYPNEKIPLSEQYQPTKEPTKKEPTKKILNGDKHADADADLANDCLVRVSKIIGNQKQVWDRIFREDAREHIFRDTADCTFQPIIKVAEYKLGETWSVVDIKNKLSAAYLKLFERDPDNLSKIAKILREQGKSKMFDKFAKAKSDASPARFQDLVMSDGYYLSDMDIWVLANEYNLPIVVFNANGLKGFFAKSGESSTDVHSQWIKMGGGKSDKYHFIRSKIRVAKGSYANHVYEYNLIVPAVALSETKEFEQMVLESVRGGRLNTAPLNDALSLA